MCGIFASEGPSRALVRIPDRAGTATRRLDDPRQALRRARLRASHLAGGV